MNSEIRRVLLRVRWLHTGLIAHNIFIISDMQKNINLFSNISFKNNQCVFIIRFMRFTTIIILCIFFFGNVAFAQKQSQIELLSAKYIKSDKNIKGGARRLIGNVKFKQDSTIMLCDSAYFYSDKNMFDAFSNVHLYKIGSSEVDVKSDFLRHHGNRKMAYFRKNVVLRDMQVVLYTDSLDYDINNDIGYYLYGAEIVDSATTLTSVKGHYYHHRNAIYFKDDVVINHNKDEYKLFTDTLKYNTINKTAYFFGPTNMVNDSNNMYAEYGWYNTNNNKALFKQNALYTNPTQSIEADSLFMDRTIEFGIAYSNVIATDSVEQFVITGNYMEVRKQMESIFVTDSAMVQSVLQGDTLFLHGDTILSVVDTVKLEIDSLQTDSIGTFRSFTAFHHVKIFKSNFQAKTDSLYFSMADSIIEFYGSPVLWAESSQITAAFIEGYIVDEVLERFKLYETGLIIAMQDSSHFNQIKGKEITGYFRNNDLYKIDVVKKSETIYFPTDDGEIIGINKANSVNVSIYMRDNEVQRIIYRNQPKSTMYPIGDLRPKEMVMKEFIWLDDQRPKKPEDIFIWE